MHGHADDTRGEHNRLLRALPRPDYQRLLPALETVSLADGRVLFETRERLTHVYFPQHGVVSLLALVGDGPAVEVAIVGNEGMVGLGVFLGARSARTRAVSLIPDETRRMTVGAFRHALTDGVVLRQLMLRYTRTLLGQISQCAACNQRHSVEQRCARWLLMAYDRVGTDQLFLTQERLGQALDVQRPTMSAAARRLREAGAIRYSRGKISLTSRTRLEGAACVCYRVIQEDYARAFSSRRP
jgi:CRP-like cAMP-binding protein